MNVPSWYTSMVFAIDEILLLSQNHLFTFIITILYGPIWITSEFISEMTYVPLVVNTFRSVLHSWIIIGFVTRLTRRVPLVVQELLILPEHLSSSPVCSGVCVTRSLVLCIFCRSLFVLVYCFFLAIVLFVLRYTDSDYPFGSQTLPISTFLFLNCHIYVECYYFVFTILSN